MERKLSRSDQLIANMFHAALLALSQSPGGQLRKSDLMQAIERNVSLNEWARAVYEGSGNTRWRSIFAFASVGLVKGGYVTKARGVWTVTEEGRGAVSGHFDGPAFLAEVNRRYKLWESSQIVSSVQAQPKGLVDEEAALVDAPEEHMARTIKAAHDALAAELIETIKQGDPAFFEQLVVQLLLKMGYGGSRQEAGRAVGQSGDGGIDGIINEDRLGLDAIYLQAKKWDGAVGEAPIRDFFGALDIQGVKKGVFITTSYFTEAAKKAVSSNRSDKKIVLIDGARLADLMIEHDLGVSVAATYRLKRLDTDFFSEE